jgi:alginate O-acetyltransferase complex protein AlgI
MPFNSAAFALFLPVVFFLYWFFAKSRDGQNSILLLAGYFFYGYWDWRFLPLLAFSTWLVFFTGRRIYGAGSDRGKKAWLLVSLVTNLGLLGFFKYWHFFTGSALGIILPLGISFYTFHGISYVLDIYHGRIRPTSGFLDYALFVGFFPLLIAGPIERATHLLPQVQQARHFDPARAVDGLKQILWGLFKKMVIADSCAEYVNLTFGNPSGYSGSMLLLGAVLFSIQIYGDFSGYTDIALGTARLFGFELLRNFAFPYFSRDIAEFWRRWHISLTSWFRDYLYIPMGGNRGPAWKRVRNILVVFAVSGFWHGANWTFIAWGALNALYFLPLLLLKRNRRHLDVVAKGKLFPSFKECCGMTATFGLTVFAWIFFRAESVRQAIGYVETIASRSLWRRPEIVPVHVLLLIAGFMAVEWTGREQEYAIADWGRAWPGFVRWSFYYALIGLIFIFGNGGSPFIYFQF